MAMFNGHTHTKWSPEIATRISEMMEHTEVEDRQLIEKALTKALNYCPEAVNMLIGSIVIEEDYFEDID